LIEKTNKKLTIFLIIIAIAGIYGLFNYFYRETGTLYSLDMSKYYNDFSYGYLFVIRTNSSDNQNNSQNYLDSETKSKEILDYLNEFELTEIRSRDKKI